MPSTFHPTPHHIAGGSLKEGGTMTILDSRSRPIDADVFRRLLRHQAASVVVVTAPGERPIPTHVDAHGAVSALGLLPLLLP